MRKKLNFILLFCFLSVLISGCTKPAVVKPPEEPKVIKDVNLKIVATNYLLYDMVKNLVKDKNDVTFMFKTEEDQWNFDFTQDSIRNTNKKDIFFYTGGEFEPWISDFVDSLNKNKIVVLNGSRGTKILPRDTAAKYVSQNKIIDVKDNPYYWMDLDKYKTAFFNITKTIEDKDSINKKYYEDNYHNMQTAFNSYEKRFKDIRTGLKDYTFVVQDDKLDYFTSYLNFTVVKLPSNFNPEDTSEDTKKIVTKLSSTDKLIFLSADGANEAPTVVKLIQTYNMKTSNIIVYQYKMGILNMMENNCESLEKWIIPTSDG